MLFSVTTKNLNWEILTKNLVTFKRWDGVKDAKFAGSLRIQFIGGEGGCHEKLMFRRELPKNGWLGQCADLRNGEGLGKKKRWCF